MYYSTTYIYIYFMYAYSFTGFIVPLTLNINNVSKQPGCSEMGRAVEQICIDGKIVVSPSTNPLTHALNNLEFEIGTQKLEAWRPKLPKQQFSFRSGTSNRNHLNNIWNQFYRGCKSSRFDIKRPLAIFLDTLKSVYKWRRSTLYPQSTKHGFLEISHLSQP